MTYELALGALSDGTRRAILERLRVRPHAVGELAAVLPVSQPAVSQHLAVLREAELVTCRRSGRRRLYGLRAEGIESVREYVDRMWGDALASYAASWEQGDRDPVEPKEER